MFEDFASVAGVFLKYGIIMFFVAFGLAIVGSLIQKLRDEPGTLAKAIFVSLAPFVLAIGIPYFIMFQQFGLPLIVNLIAGLVIYAASHDFLERRVDARFKDERQ